MVHRFKHKTNFLVGILFIALGLTPHASLAATRPSSNPICGGLLKMFEDKKIQKEKVAAILKLNEDYLVNNPNLSHSIRVKIGSNKAMAFVQLETLDNEMQLTQKQMHDKGCNL